MAIRTILHFPDPRLRRQAQPVTAVTDEIRRLVDDMAETMYDAPGIGLAATQIDVPLRIIVIDISDVQGPANAAEGGRTPGAAETRDRLQVFINPRILSSEGHQSLEEGCLSVPGIYEEVARAQLIRVQALNRDGQPFEIEVEGLLATCIQHEIDHLDGKVFIDYLSRLKQSRIRKKLEKQQRIAM